MIWFEGALVAVRSVMQKIVALSSAEAELIALVLCIQEMMYVKKLIEAIELQVKLPMLVECDNKATVDLVNGHSTSSETKHIDVRYMYARELKEAGIIKRQWIPTEENEADMLPKNTDHKTFNRHSSKFMREVPPEQGGVLGHAGAVDLQPRLGRMKYSTTLQGAYRMLEGQQRKHNGRSSSKKSNKVKSKDRDNPKVLFIQSTHMMSLVLTRFSIAV